MKTLRFSGQQIAFVLKQLGIGLGMGEGRRFVFSYKCIV